METKPFPSVMQSDSEASFYKPLHFFRFSTADLRHEQASLTLWVTLNN